MVDVSEIEKLKGELEAERTRADNAEAESNKMKKTHETYKKTKQREVSSLKGEIAAAPSKAEYDRVKAEAATGKITMSDEERAAAMQSKQNPKTAFMELIKLCTTALEDAIKDHAAANAAGSSTASTRAPFEFFDNTGTWVAITDSTVVSALKALMTQQSKKVSYSFGGHNYEAT
eukprot:6885796-Prymnesium_polylepis.1